MRSARQIAPIVAVMFACAALPISARAQTGTAAIVGEVVDSSSGRPVSQVQVSVSGTSLRAVSDLAGRFVIRDVPPGVHAVEARRIGYAPMVRTGIVVGAGERITLGLSIQPAPFRLAELTITPGSFSFLDAGPAGLKTISREDIQAAPFGEDLFRAVNRLPGLASGDYGAHFSIRGGRQDETLILLDGLEIYEPFHLKDFNDGALSIIDVETIDRVDLLTGGFPAHYGDKRSGVMSITSRTPNRDGTHVSAGASFSNARALAEGTFGGDKGSWLLSGRRGFVDLLLGIINKKETKAPTYQDFFGTVRYQVHPNHGLALHALHASDRYRFSILGTTGFNDSIPTVEAADNGYGNSYAWATLRSLFGAHLSVTTLASAGLVTASRKGDEHHASIPLELYGVEGSRDFNVLGLKQDLRFQPSNRMVFDWGYDARRMHAMFDWTNRVTQNPDDPTPDTTGYYPHVTRRSTRANGWTVGGYASNRLQAFGPVSLEAGVRYDQASYTGDKDWSPRFNALLRLWNRGTLRAGWGLYRQRQGIADENAFDRLNRYFPSELSRQWNAGLELEHRYAGGGALRAEAYHKTGSHLRPILRNWKSGLNVFPESAEDRILVYPEETTSKGLEIHHEGGLGKRLNLRAGYALAFVEERVSRIDQVNDPLTPPFASTHPGPQDQRHALNVDVTYRPNRNWSLTTAYTFHSGWPFTDEIGVPVTRRNGTMDLAVRPDSLYGSRLPPYHRMDMRLTWHKQTGQSDWRFFVEVINLTNHQNVLGYDVYRVIDANGALRLQRDPETWFSILPSLGVSWSRRL